MEKAIEVLMSEHRLIEQVLGSLETFTSEIEGGLAPEPPLLADYGAFFREFADSCHHGKEEDVLFQRMDERGFPRETGPVAVMLYEHEVGRGHVSALRQVGEARVRSRPRRPGSSSRTPGPSSPSSGPTFSRRTGSSTRWRCAS